MEKSNYQLFICMCIHGCTCPPTHTSHACQHISVRCIFEKYHKIYSFDLCSYRLILWVVFYCWAILYSDLWCDFSTCRSLNLSFLNHLFDFWPYLSSKAFGNQILSSFPTWQDKGRLVLSLISFLVCWCVVCVIVLFWFGLFFWWVFVCVFVLVWFFCF